MEDFQEECVVKDIVKDGKKVTVIATFIEENSWELSINGKHGQFTTWTEFFVSSNAALAAGYAAILKEGIDEFYSSPEFSYLDKL